MKKLISLFTVFLSIITLSVPAYADVLYSTFGHGQSFGNTGWLVGSGASYNQQIAAPFTLSFDAILHSIDFAADYDSGPNQLTVNLVYDDSGLPSTDPGRVIESFNFTNLSPASTIYTANSSLNPLLKGSTQYWVVLKTDDTTTQVRWNRNNVDNIDIRGLVYCNPPVPIPWTYYKGKTPAFDIKGSAAVPDPLEVYIDIKPGSDLNSINPRSRGVIPVAILTTKDFDATAVNPSTVLFGKTGTEASPFHFAFEDVDGDGNIDMILHFRTQETGLVCGDTEAILTGESLNGQAIEGSDSIKTVGCKNSTLNSRHRSLKGLIRP